MAENQKILELKGVSKSFGKSKILEDVDLTLTKKQIHVILGPTGCGKTTLLSLIAGLEDLDKGEIWIRDKLIADEGKAMSPRERDVGMVFQDTAVWPHMTVRENIEFALKGGENHYKRLLNVLNLESLEERMPHTLSGGQRQCVAIARALAQKPSMLLLDEPMANLDWSLKKRLLDLIKVLKKEFEVSMIYVTHDQLEAFSIADVVTLMNQGRVEQTGVLNDFFSKPSSDFVSDFIIIPSLLKELQSISPKT
ncbi:MAG: ABC transporter ATP-binding protein [Candidatus Altiarchaeota archaeon]